MQGPAATGVHGPASGAPRQQEAALKFAQCIRENGVKDFPDPANGEPLVDTNRIPSAAADGGMTDPQRRDAEVRRRLAASWRLGSR